MSLLKRLQEKGVVLKGTSVSSLKSPAEKVAPIEKEILELFYQDAEAMSKINPETLRGYFTSKIMQKGRMLSIGDRAFLLDKLLGEVIGLSVLEPYLSKQDIQQVKVDAEGVIWIGNEDSVSKADLSFRDQAHLKRTLDRFMHQIELALQAGNFAAAPKETERSLYLTLPFALETFVQRTVIGPSTAAFLEAFSVPREGEEGCTIDLGRILFLYKG